MQMREKRRVNERMWNFWNWNQASERSIHTFNINKLIVNYFIENKFRSSENKS